MPEGNERSTTTSKGTTAPPAPEAGVAAAEPAANPGESAASRLYGPNARIVVLTPSEELDLLEHIDVGYEALVRLRRGRHPNPKVERLLDTRFHLASKDYAAPAVVQIICTAALMLSGCTIGAVVIFTAGSIFNFTEFLRVASLLLADFTIMMLVASVFLPLPWFNEVTLARDCARQRDEVMARLKR